MKFDQLLAIVADEPVFETGLLLAGSVNPSDMRRQLVRWTQVDDCTSYGAGSTRWHRPTAKPRPIPSSSPIDWCAALMSAVCRRWHTLV